MRVNPIGSTGVQRSGSWVRLMGKKKRFTAIFIVDSFLMSFLVSTITSVSFIFPTSCLNKSLFPTVIRLLTAVFSITSGFGTIFSDFLMLQKEKFGVVQLLHSETPTFHAENCNFVSFFFLASICLHFLHFASIDLFNFISYTLHTSLIFLKGKI